MRDRDRDLEFDGETPLASFFAADFERSLARFFDSEARRGERFLSDGDLRFFSDGDRRFSPGRSLAPFFGADGDRRFERSLGRLTEGEPLRGERFFSEGNLRFLSDGDRRLLDLDRSPRFSSLRVVDLFLDRSERLSSRFEVGGLLDEDRFRASDLRFEDSRFRDDERFFSDAPLGDEERFFEVDRLRE